MGLYIVRQNNDDEKYIETISGQIPGQGVPLGTILPYYGTTAPSSNWLICDGSTFDVDQYPALYVFLKSNILPDLREVVLVGAGTNSTLSIADHDVYKVGEFKDDQLQDHNHAVRNSNAAAGGYAKQLQDENPNLSPKFPTNGWKAVANGRSGTTTHGKQVGVNYVIKATSVASDTDKQSLYNEMIAYMNDQNELSDYETITLPTTDATAFEMPYDGKIFIQNFISSTSSSSDCTTLLYVDGVSFGVTYGSSGSFELSVKKGQKLYYTITGSSNSVSVKVAYYKKRDYSQRS